MASHWLTSSGYISLLIGWCDDWQEITHSAHTDCSHISSQVTTHCRVLKSAAKCWLEITILQTEPGPAWGLHTPARSAAGNRKIFRRSVNWNWLGIWDTCHLSLTGHVTVHVSPSACVWQVWHVTNSFCLMWDLSCDHKQQLLGSTYSF